MPWEVFQPQCGEIGLQVSANSSASETEEVPLLWPDPCTPAISRGSVDLSASSHPAEAPCCLKMFGHRTKEKDPFSGALESLWEGRTHVVWRCHVWETRPWGGQVAGGEDEVGMPSSLGGLGALEEVLGAAGGSHACDRNTGCIWKGCACCPLMPALSSQ